MKHRPTKAHNAQHFHVQQQRRKKVERWQAVKSYKRALKETGEGSGSVRHAMLVYTHNTQQGTCQFSQM